MEMKKADTRWKTFYKFCIRSLINKLMIRQSYDCLRFSGTGTLNVQNDAVSMQNTNYLLLSAGPIES